MIYITNDNKDIKVYLANKLLIEGSIYKINTNLNIFYENEDLKAYPALGGILVDVLEAIESGHERFQHTQDTSDAKQIIIGIREDTNAPVIMCNKISSIPPSFIGELEN